MYSTYGLKLFMPTLRLLHDSHRVVDYFELWLPNVLMLFLLWIEYLRVVFGVSSYVRHINEDLKLLKLSIQTRDIICIKELLRHCSVLIA